VLGGEVEQLGDLGRAADERAGERERLADERVSVERRELGLGEGAEAARRQGKGSETARGNKGRGGAERRTHIIEPRWAISLK